MLNARSHGDPSVSCIKADQPASPKNGGQAGSVSTFETSAAPLPQDVTTATATLAPITEPVDRESLRRRYTCIQHFRKTIAGLPLFQQSARERLVIIGLSVLGGSGGSGRVPVASEVVPRMLIWERFLAHRSRHMRRVTLAVALHQRQVQQKNYVPAAMATLLTEIAHQGNRWENQPLNITVAECDRYRILDPRRTTGDAFRIAVIKPDGTTVRCEFDLPTIASCTESECLELVYQQLNLGNSAAGPISAVFESQAFTAEELSGRYAQYPGAWLSVAPDRETGGLAISADHLVLDGALLQKLLVRMAVSSSRTQEAVSSPVAHESPAAALAGVCATTQAAAVQAVSACRADQRVVAIIAWPGSMTRMFRFIIQALQQSGLQLHEGRDMISLTTIPEDGPDVNLRMPRYRRRVLPVQICVANVTGDDDLRNRIRQANVNGWCSIGPLMVNRLYNGNIRRLMIRYIERVAPNGRLLRAFRYLAGAAVVSFLPPVLQEDLQGAQVSHLSAITLGPVQGGPTVTVMQVRSADTAKSQLYVTISGTDDWNCPNRLNSLLLAVQTAADN